MYEIKIFNLNDLSSNDTITDREHIGTLYVHNRGPVLEQEEINELRMFSYRLALKDHTINIKHAGHLTHKQTEGFIVLLQKIFNQIIEKKDDDLA